MAQRAASCHLPYRTSPTLIYSATRYLMISDLISKLPCQFYRHSISLVTLILAVFFRAHKKAETTSEMYIHVRVAVPSPNFRIGWSLTIFSMRIIGIISGRPRRPYVATFSNEGDIHVVEMRVAMSHGVSSNLWCTIWIDWTAGSLLNQIDTIVITLPKTLLVDAWTTILTPHWPSNTTLTESIK